MRVLGNLAYEDLRIWYQRASVVVLPSLHEGFARVLVEGYLFSKPAVATRCGGPQDIILDGETGFLVETYDLNTFAQKIIWLLQHPERAAAMGERGQFYVRENFDRDNLISKMVTQWQQLSGMIL